MVEYNKNDCKESDSNLNISWLLGVYVLLIGVGLPLVVKDKYFDILIIKYYYYCACTITMFIIVIAILGVRRNRKEIILTKDSVKDLLKKLTWSDYFVLFFYVVALLSTITSNYLYESFWGNEGRYTGLFLITWYVVTYFCISKLCKFSKRYLDFFLLSGVIVCIFGITDYFNLDILNFKADILEEQKKIFTSTIGNINTYTAYIGIIVAINAVLFSQEKHFRKILFYYTGMFIGFFAIIMGNSDNAYLSLGALFAFLPLYLFKNSEGIRRYIIILATFFSVTRCIGWINIYFSERVIGIDSFFNMIIDFKGFTIVIVGLWLIVGLWYYIDYRKERKNVEYRTIPRLLWLGLLICASLYILYILYDCNIAGNVEKYSNVASFVLFNDDWGTHRGYIWRNAIECYMSLSPWKKLVGYGPETFGILMLQKTAGNPYSELFDSAHNEYLHLLTTVGLAGVLSYLGFIIAVIRQGLLLSKKNPYIMAVVFGVICYCAQAFVNLNIPIVTPIFWVLLGLASNKVEKKK